MTIRKRVRELNLRFEERIDFLKKQYEEELLELQAKCEHRAMTRWAYELDTYNELASNVDGTLYRFRECLDCGAVQKKLDDINDYESEVKF